MKKSANPISAFVLIMTLLGSTPMNAQSSNKEEKQITVSGRVVCVSPINGTLSSVIVYNLNQERGTMTDKKGMYSIQMGKNDTVMFSTAEHKESLFFLGGEDPLEDRIHNVHMVIDEVWQSTVDIIGENNLEQFKQEIINLNIPIGNPTFVLPVVNKFVKLTPLSAAEIDLEGPLTYLQKKFSKHNRFKKKLK